MTEDAIATVKIGVLVVLFITLFVWLLSMSDIIHYVDVQANWIECEAVITGSNMVGVRRFNGKAWYTSYVKQAYYNYVVDGVLYDGVASTGSTSLSSGTTIKIRYNPDCHGQSELTNQ